MPKRFQGFVQLSATHGDVGFGLLDRGVQSGLRVIDRCHRHRRCALGSCHALGELASLFTLQAGVTLLEAPPRPVAFEVACTPFIIVAGQVTDDRQNVSKRAHLDTVDRAGRNTQVATGALVDNHGVHQLGGTHNGVHRAGLDAFGTADAFALADIGDLRRRISTAGVQLQYRQAQQLREPGNGFLPTGRALVDGFAFSDAFCVGLATRVPALAALSLRQQRVDTLNEVHAVIIALTPGPGRRAS